MYLVFVSFTTDLFLEQNLANPLSWFCASMAVVDAMIRSSTYKRWTKISLSDEITRICVQVVSQIREIFTEDYRAGIAALINPQRLVIYGRLDIHRVLRENIFFCINCEEYDKLIEKDVSVD